MTSLSLAAVGIAIPAVQENLVEPRVVLLEFDTNLAIGTLAPVDVAAKFYGGLGACEVESTVAYATSNRSIGL